MVKPGLRTKQWAVFQQRFSFPCSPWFAVSSGCLLFAPLPAWRSRPLSSSSPDLLQSDAATSSMHRDWNSKYVRLQLLLPHRQSDVHHLPPHLHADQDAPGYLSPGGPLSYRIQHIQNTGSYTPLNPPDRSSLFLAPPSSPSDFSPSRSRVTLPRYDDHWESLYSSRPTSMLPTPRHPSSTAAVSTRPWATAPLHS